MALGLDHRLATYGSLAPGQENHHILNGVDGVWIEGTVGGTLVQMGWGADLGYPAIILDETNERVNVWILESAALPDHWQRLDAFEGEQYDRVTTVADTALGGLPVSIYALRTR